MKVSTENDNNFGYEQITIVVDNIPLNNELPTPHLSFTALVITWMMYSAFTNVDCQTLVKHMKMSAMSLNIAQVYILHHGGMFCKYR
jgi:hypothetical protein